MSNDAVPPPADSGPGERTLITRILETSPIGVVVLDADGTVFRLNARAETLLDASRSDLLGRRYDEPDWVACDETGTVRDGFDPIAQVFETREAVFDAEIVVRGGSDLSRWLSVNCAPMLDDEGDLSQVVVTLKDVTETKIRERTLRRQRAELEQLNRLNSVIRRIQTALVSATSADEIEETVCSRLVSTDGYATAFVARLNASCTELVSYREAGVERVGDESAPASIPADRVEASVLADVTRTGEVRVLRRVAADSIFGVGGGRRGDDERSALAAVPLRYRDVEHGVLGVLTDRDGALDERERQVLAELGESIAHALDAVRTRRLLHSDTVLELEFLTTDPGVFFVDISERADCSFWLQGTAQTAGESILYYLLVEGVDTERFVDLAAAYPSVDSVRLVAEVDGRAAVQVVMTGRALTATLSNHGARTCRAWAKGGESRVVAEVSPDTDVRMLVEALQTAFPETQLVAKRERARPLRTGPEFREHLVAPLTQRQRDALKASYLGGYYEWPRRGSSAEELATAMGVSPTTFHQHLRAAQRKLLAGVFDADVDSVV